jgi:hypothetical protein
MTRYVALGAGVGIVFAIVVVVLLALMPAPHRQIDFMVAGSVATLVAMFVLFLVLVSTTMKSSNIFFTRRKK